MHRPIGKRFIYVLIAALLFAQQGFALHALSHGVDAIKTASGERPDSRAPLSDRLCDLCITYAQVAAGAAPTTPTFVSAAVAHAVPAVTVVEAAAAPRPAYLSRAPPLTA